MKLYLHYEDDMAPFTLAVNVVDRSTTVSQLKQTFVDAFNKSYAHHSPLDVSTCDIIKHKGSRVVADNIVVMDVFTQKQDLFVVCSRAAEPFSNIVVAEKMTSVKKTQNQENPYFSNLARCTDLYLHGVATLEVKGSCERQGQSKRAVVTQCCKLLDVDPQNLDALATLVEIYFAVYRWKKTLMYAESGRKHYPTEILFWLRVAQCRMMSGDLDLAVKQLEKSIAQEGKNKPQTSSKFNQEAQVALSEAYMLLGKKEKAFSVVQRALRNDKHYLPALVQYAKLTYDLGRKEALAAVTIVLTAIVNEPGNKRFEKAMVEICTCDSNNEILERALGPAWKSVTGLMVLASTFRDNGAIEKAKEILDRALVVSPRNYAAMLMYVHILEVLNRHEEAFVKMVSFLQLTSSGNVGKLLHHLTQAAGQLHFYDGSQGDCDSENISLSLEAPPGNDDSVLQAVALWFTLIKIIYIKGALCLLGPLLRLLDPFYNFKNLHKTFIRNEAAYYGSICRSRCYTIHPILSTGTKLWHLSRDSIFYPKVNFYNALQCIPDGATVVFNFGEIDCRESLHQSCDCCKYESLEEAIVTLIDIYIDILLDLATHHHWVIYVHPVCPVLTRNIVMQFNNHLEKRLSTIPQLTWLDFVHDLFTPDGSCLQKIYDFDGVHLHPCYVRLLEKSINRCQSSQSTLVTEVIWS